MRILFIGDVIASAGCEFVMKKLPTLKKELKPDFCIINAENSAQGNGILPVSAQSLLAAGADALTSGNHAFRRHEIMRVFEEGRLPLIRPMNFHRDAPGKGMITLERGGLRLGVANIMGRVYMDQVNDPFDCIDEIITAFSSQGIKNIFVDLHAEATGEKRALSFYCDGRLSALVGTHTHVQTADEQITEKGMAYITDVGMTGCKESVLGIKPECAVTKVRTGLPIKFENPEGVIAMNAVLIETDTKSGRAISIERLNVE